MKINYICRGFDKDAYSFDAVVVPVAIKYNSRKELEVSSFCDLSLIDFRSDFNEIIKNLSVSALQSDRVTDVRSEKTGIRYIFILIRHIECIPRRTTSLKTQKLCNHENYVFCCEKLVESINKFDVRNILIHPAFNKEDFRHDMDSDFLAETLRNSIDRFSRKDIYILIEDSLIMDGRITNAVLRMKEGKITYKKCVEIFVERKMERSNSSTNRFMRIAEINTIYKPESVAKNFMEDMKNSSWFFYEYVRRYINDSTAVKLAKNANISSSAISKIKDHTYKSVKKYMAISLAIALDLTVEDRKRFINSAGFSYPITEHDHFIEQQLRKKKYTRVIDFNKDIMDEYPQFVIKKE